MFEDLIWRILYKFFWELNTPIIGNVHFCHTLRVAVPAGGGAACSRRAPDPMEFIKINRKSLCNTVHPRSRPWCSLIWLRPWILELGSSRFVYFQLITCLFSFGKIAYNIIAYIYTNKISDIISVSPCCLQLRGCKTAPEEIACLDLPFSFQANKVDFAGRFYIP